MPASLLIIFVRNPVRGKVKTRLAATLGPDQALAVYQLLLDRTLAVTRPLEVEKAVYFSDNLDDSEAWELPGFQKHVQQGTNLGDRMARAFAAAFGQGYRRVGIIGSDCYELSTDLLREAFARLADNNLVIGPATDGGYYFLGMDSFQPALFQDKAWSTAALLRQTLADAERLQLQVALLPALSDVDEEKDLATIPGYRAGGT